jgi:protein subunit release factor A
MSEPRTTTPTDDALAEHAELEAELADPAVHADQARARELGRRYAELGPLVAAIRERDQAAEDLEAAREMAGEDAEFAAEARQLEQGRRRPRLPHPRAAGAARSRRRQGRHPRGQGR